MGESRSQFEPRSHFAMRLVLLALLLAPSPVVVVAASDGVLNPVTAQALMQPLLVLAVGVVLLARPLLFRDPEDGGEGDDGGGGSGPGPPPSPGGPSPAGIPLPDALPGRWRRRDHVRPGRLWGPARRPVREPQRPRVRD